MSAQVVEDEDYQLRYEIVAGIDVAKESAVVCVRMPRRRGGSTGRRTCRRCRQRSRRSGELATELKLAGVQMVSMEATSDYWRIWFAVLEEAGLAVQLVNSSQARNLPGRPKTDLLTELPRGLLKVSGQTGTWVATVAGHDHRRRSAAGLVPFGSAAVRLA